MVGTRRSAATAVASLMAAMLLAGCFGGESSPKDESPDPVDGGTPDPLPIDPETFVATAPAWQVGDWFDVQFQIKEGDGSLSTLSTKLVVIEAGFSGYRVAVADADAAKYDAAFDLPFVGNLDASLGGTMFEGAFAPWMFPIRNGSTWEVPITVGSFPPVAVNAPTVALFREFTADEVGADLAGPGFVIESTMDEDAFMQFNYLPELGFADSLVVWDLSTEEAGDIMFSMEVSDWGSNWTGTWHLYEGEALVAHLSGIAMDPEDPNNRILQPGTPERFEVAEGTSYLYGFLFAFAFAGQYMAGALAPDGKTVESIATGTPEATDVDVIDWANPPAGTWEVASGGAGVAVFGGVFLWGINEATGTL